MSLLVGAFAAGTGLRLVSTPSAPQLVAADALGLAWLAGDGIWTAERDGSNPRKIASLKGTSAKGFLGALVLDATHVYWSTGCYADVEDPCGVLRAPRRGGNTEQVLDSACGVALDTTHVYSSMLTYSTEKGPRNELVRVPKSGGSIDVLAHHPAHAHHPEHSFDESLIAADGRHVFWLNAGSEGVLRVEREGGDPVRLAEGQGRLDALALDESHVYWLGRLRLDGLPDHRESVGYVRRVHKAGGRVTTLAAFFEEEQGTLALDSSHVYVLQGRRLLRVAKTGGEMWTLPREVTPASLALGGDGQRWVIGGSWDEASGWLLLGGRAP